MLPFRKVAMFLLLSTGCQGVLIAQSSHAEERLQAIIDNIRLNEDLYENIDVKMNFIYRLAEPLAESNRRPAETALGSMTTTLTQDLQIRYVNQDEFFRVDVTGTKTTTGEPVSPNRIRMYDGVTTRLLDQNQVGNLIKGRSEDSEIVRPHMLLGRSSWGTVYLSELFQGYEALIASPNCRWEPSLLIEVEYLGETEFQSLRCHQIQVTTRSRGQENWNARKHWLLAEDRNYLPVRVVSWTFRWSPDIPIGEAVVDEFREVEPGIWFPYSATRTSFSHDAVQRDGRQQVRWQERYQIEEVSLNPKHDISFFRDLEFPDGIAMYEVENGTTTRSYIVGARADSENAASLSASYQWLLWLNVALFIGFIAIYYYRVRRRRVASQPPDLTR